MTVNRTTLLDLPLPVTGTESGTWGDTTNNGLSQYMDIAIAGMNSLTSANFTAGALTLANTLGDSSATNIAAGSAQYATIRVSSLAVNSTITAPGSNRSYRIINADATYSLTIKASGQTGVTFLPGQTGVVAFNGTDYVIVGVVGAGTATDNAVARFDGTTGKLVQNSVVTIADSTGDISGVGQLNATTVDATNIEVTNIKAKDGTAAASIADSTGVISITSNPVLSGGTANGVLYLNGSKVATSGSALSFDGTNLLQVNAAAGKLRLGVNTSDQFLDIYRDNGSGASVYNAAQGSGFGFHVWQVANTEQMRLTSTGLGIGTSSPSVQIDANKGGTAYSGNLYLTGKFTDGTAALKGVGLGYDNTSQTGIIYAYTGSAASNLSFWTYPGSGSTTERMRLDSSGNLGLGVTPSAWGGSYKGLQVNSTGALTSNGSNATGVGHNYYFDGTNNRYLTTGAANLYLMINSEHRWYTAPSGTAGNAITFTQAMTLDASGNLLVGATSGSYHTFNKSSSVALMEMNNSNASPVGLYITYTGASPNGTANEFLTCRDTTANRVVIRSNGGIANYSANDVNLSDRREKTNLAPAKSYLDTICAIPVQTFNYIDQAEDDLGLTLGVVAQDVQAVAPELVMESNWGTKDEPKIRLSIYQTDLQYALMKCIQEQQALITSLTARVALLEGN